MDATFTEGMMPGPDGSILRFMYDTERNEVASISEGRPIFDTVLLVDVITPGQKSSTPRFEVERIWAEQSLKYMPPNSKKNYRSYKYAEYEEQIDKFKRQETVNEMGGTPLKLWPRIDRGLAATLMAANVYTVEQLASVSDGNLEMIGMGARELREQAKTFLESAAGTADLSAMTDKLSNMELEHKRLTEALALANNQIAELQRKMDTVPENKLPDITLT